MLPAITKRFEMRLRARAPRFIRQLYRVVRSIGDNGDRLSKPLPAVLVEGCCVCASREDMLRKLPKEGRVAELGTYKGSFARSILARANPRELHVVDIDYSLFDRNLLKDPRVKCHAGFTHAIISSFEDNYFDWVYVDADHSYEGVLRDARATAAKVKPGGYMVFNDFAHIDPFLGRYGVHRAVTEFLLEHGWQVAFFSFDPAALYDIGLRRPQ